MLLKARVEAPLRCCALPAERWARNGATARALASVVVAALLVERESSIAPAGVARARPPGDEQQ
jgi:hypothetical protein